MLLSNNKRRAAWIDRDFFIRKTKQKCETKLLGWDRGQAQRNNRPKDLESEILSIDNIHYFCSTMFNLSVKSRKCSHLPELFRESKGSFGRMETASTDHF